ncbi:hypothetical protein P4H42_04230 [Paenibacillus macerans]|uniref:hypothetical protein n=1 Tax=Paenibacillus macerans TaxID=44252 RepID=UPI002DBF3D42|nr:hypothetical protein [Paenibacillus macerans]MEC0328830.1 hypothetical protein [Paenibacillus macerans]
MAKIRFGKSAFGMCMLGIMKEAGNHARAVPQITAEARSAPMFAYVFMPMVLAVVPPEKKPIQNSLKMPLMQNAVN